MLFRPYILPAMLFFACSICSSMQAGVIQEVQKFNSLMHGDIVFASDPDQTKTNYFEVGGITVSGDNFNDGRDFIVGFNTRRDDTQDNDLEDPFTKGNNQNFNYRDVLIIQEQGVGRDNDNNGRLDDPIGTTDDEGGRPAGEISFDFDQAIDAFGVDLLDVEGPLEEFSFEFFSNGSSVGKVEFEEFLGASERSDGVNGEFYDSSAPVEFGNNSANRIVPITAQELADFEGSNTVSTFDRVTVRLGGSGAIDNIFTSRIVPEPELATLWMMAGVIGLCGLERRKKHREFQLLS